MKKLLSIAAVSALLVTGANAGTITLNAEMPATANVALGVAASLGSAGDSTFTDFTAQSVTLAFGTATSNTAQTLFDQEVNLITNNEASAVTMQLSTINNLISSTTADTLTPTCSYDIGSTGTYASQGASDIFALTSGAASDNANNVVGKLKCETLVGETQGAGTYTGTITVDIVAG